MKNNIFALGNFNSHITQININGSSKEEIEQLCLKLINDQMSILRDDAAEIFKNQVREYAELFYRQLLKMPEGVDVVNRLKTPAVQFALDESLMIYSKHPSVDEKELQKLKNKFESNHHLQCVNYLQRAQNLAHYEAYGDAHLIDTEVERYQAISNDNLRAAARKFLTKKNSTVLRYLSK